MCVCVRERELWFVACAHLRLAEGELQRELFALLPDHVRRLVKDALEAQQLRRTERRADAFPLRAQVRVAERRAAAQTAAAANRHAHEARPAAHGARVERPERPERREGARRRGRLQRRELLERRETDARRRRRTHQLLMKQAQLLELRRDGGRQWADGAGAVGPEVRTRHTERIQTRQWEGCGLIGGPELSWIA